MEESEKAEEASKDSTEVATPTTDVKAAVTDDVTTETRTAADDKPNESCEQSERTEAPRVSEQGDSAEVTPPAEPTDPIASAQTEHKKTTDEASAAEGDAQMSESKEPQDAVDAPVEAAPLSALKPDVAQTDAANLAPPAAVEPPSEDIPAPPAPEPVSAEAQPAENNDATQTTEGQGHDASFEQSALDVSSDRNDESSENDRSKHADLEERVQSLQRLIYTEQDAQQEVRWVLTC